MSYEAWGEPPDPQEIDYYECLECNTNWNVDIDGSCLFDAGGDLVCADCGNVDQNKFKEGYEL